MATFSTYAIRFYFKNFRDVTLNYGSLFTSTTQKKLIFIKDYFIYSTSIEMNVEKFLID